MTNYEIAIAVVSKATGVSKKKMLSASREWPAVEARQLVTLLLYGEGMTDERISWILKRKRSTIQKARHTALETMGASRAYREKYNQIKAIYEERKSLREAEN